MMTGNKGFICKKAVFLDRDGTINKEVDYLSRVEDVSILPGVAGAIRSFKKAGYLVFVVTNQGGIAKGKLTLQQYFSVTSAVIAMLAARDAFIDGLKYCPHHPEGIAPSLSINCRCRKPEPGMILDLAGEFNISLSESWMVGDKLTDLESGWRAGCKTILVRSGYGSHEEKRLADIRVDRHFAGTVDGLVDTIRFICP